MSPNCNIPVFGIAVALLLSLTSAPAQSKHFKVFLMGGQSNMFGYGTAPTSLPTELQAPQEDIRFYYGTNFTFLQPGSGGAWGSEITFGRTIADAFPEENFYFIKHSDGGTSLWNEWNLTNGRSYNLFREVVGFGLDGLTRAGHTYEIVGMLWAQGERDAWNLRTTAQYEADFKAFITDIRSRYGADLPFLFARLSVKQTARPIEKVRLAQELVAASDPKVHMIDADDFGILNDNLHYTAQGYIDMGKDFALAYLNSLNGDHAGNSSVGISGNGTRASTTVTGIIDGNLITASASAPSMSNVAFNFNNGTQAWHPYRTTDGSGLSGGEHDSANHTGWLVRKESIQGVSPDVADSHIQWDLGANYPLESIRIWNMNRNGDTGSGIRSVDVYLSNVEFPGDPEGVGAENWTKLGGATLEFPQAPASGNTGFDLETATSTTLPATEVRTIRFELNTNWNGDNSYTGLSEIQFTAASRGIDTTPPALAILRPSHNASGVNPASNLSITFTEDIALGTGEIRLLQSGGTLVQTFDLANPSPALSVSGATLTLNPSSLLASSTTFYVEIDITAITDILGNNFAGISGDVTWSFTTAAADITAPNTDFQSPRPAAAGVNPSTNLIVIFDEPVAFGSGTITLRESGGAIVQSFDVANPADGLTLSNKSLTLNPSADLDDSTTYYVEIAATAIEDLAGNPFAGISGESAWSFTTIVPDVTAPDIASTNPVNGADFFPADNLFVTFDEWIALGTGFIHIRESDGTLVESFDVANPSSGVSHLADIVTINPTNDLPLGKSFYVEIESTAILDNAGNHYTGTVGNTTWNFVVAASVDYTTITHVGTQFDIESGTNDPTFGWRNPTPAKPLDIDGDNILGTDGYQTSARTSNPVYAITAIRAPNGNGGGKVYDDPTNPAGEDIGLQALHDASAGNGQESRPLLDFVITEDLPEATTLRVGILLDLITVSNGSNTATYTIKQTFGGTASATTPALEWTGDTLDVAYFDLTNVRATHRYVITSTTIDTPNHPGPFEQVVGVTFDTGTTGPDETAPEVSALDPANTSDDFDPAANLNISFNEDVAFVTGTITLRQIGGAVVESFDVANPPAGLSLSENTITINPTNDLANSTTYCIEIDATAIEDLAGNPFAGFSGDGTWSFTTAAADENAPSIDSLSPVNGAGAVAAGSNLTIAFNEAVAFGTGSITLRESGGAEVESFDVVNPPAGLSISGASVTLTPTSGLTASTTYYVEIDATAIDDLAGNSFAGFSGNGTWSFTTAAAGVTIGFDFGTPTGNVRTGYTGVTTNGGSNDGTALVGGNISVSYPAGQTLHHRDRGTANFTDTTNADLLRDIVYFDGMTTSDAFVFTLTGLSPSQEYQVHGYAVDMFGATTNDDKTVSWTTSGGTVQHTTDSANEDLASARFQMENLIADANGEATVVARYVSGGPSIILWNGFDIVAVSAPDPFTVWADLGTLPGTVTFRSDLNSDGVPDGLAFLLGVANPDNDATGALPVLGESGSDGLVLTFDCLPVDDRGGAGLKVAHSGNLSEWTPTTGVVPDADGTDAGGVVSYMVDMVSVAPLHRVTATIDPSAGSGDKLFARIEATK